MIALVEIPCLYLHRCFFRVVSLFLQNLHSTHSTLFMSTPQPTGGVHTGRWSTVRVVSLCQYCKRTSMHSLSRNFIIAYLSVITLNLPTKSSTTNIICTKPFLVYSFLRNPKSYFAIIMLTNFHNVNESWFDLRHDNAQYFRLCLLVNRLRWMLMDT